jgi:prepilin-type processing-associated H-X9-DG protein
LKGSNITFVDGHTKWMQYTAIWARWLDLYRRGGGGYAYEIFGLWNNGPWFP